MSDYLSHYFRAKIEIKSRFGLNELNEDALEEYYNTHGYITREEKDAMSKAIENYCKTYAGIANSIGVTDISLYKRVNDQELYNLNFGIKYFETTHSEPLDGSDFFDDVFQDMLFNQFFQYDATQEKFTPNLNSGFSVLGDISLTKTERTKLENELKNRAIGGILDVKNPLTPAKDSYTQAQTAAKKFDPLLVDLDGDGIETTSLQNGIFFDHANDGFEEISAWVGEDDGIIVVDKNNNGIIDNGTELLGDNYVKTNGEKATSGFDALKDFDSNGDKVINNKDANFNQLKVLKGDGTLLSLEEAGISSISLSTATKKVTDANGNTQLIKGSYTNSDGTKLDIADYSFVLDTINSIATEWIDETDEVTALPDIQGVGTVYSLHQAILRDESGELKQLVQQFLNDTSFDNTTTKRDLVKQILYKWTGADSVEEGSRGDNFGAKNLHVIEQFMGEAFIGVDKSGNPNDVANNLLNYTFFVISDYVYSQLQAQSSLKSLYDLIGKNYNIETGELSYNLNALQAYIDNCLAANEESGKSLLSDFVRTFSALGLIENSNYTEFYEHYESMGIEFKYLLDTAGKALIQGIDGDNNIEGSALPEAVFTGAGNDTIYTRQGNDIVYAGDGDDYIDTCEDDDVIFGEGGNDTIYAGAGNDIIYGGSGDDIIYGEEGNDIIYGGDGDDEIHAGLGDDIIYSGAGNNKIYTDRGNNIVYAEDGDDIISSSGTNNIIYAGGGNDTITTGPGQHTIYGGDGDDKINATSSCNDTYIGGRGNDTMTKSHGGDDIFIFNKGDGNDIITNELGNDKIIFGEGISPENIRFHGRYNDLIISFTDSTDTITIKNSVIAPNYRIETLEFADGTIITADEYLTRLVNQGTEGDDEIHASNGNDIIYGNGGNDKIYAHNGDDIIYTLDGDDYINTGNGTNTVYSGAGDDTIIVSGNSTVYAGDGNDIIKESSGDHIIYCGNGDDKITAQSSGNATYIGSRGNDEFSKTKQGDDTFIFNQGDGNDIIYNQYGNDTIIFKDDINIEDIAFYMDAGKHLFIDYGTETGKDTIKIKYFGRGSTYAIENFIIENSSGESKSLTNEDINKLIQDMTAYAATNDISISSVAEVKENPDLMNLVINSWAA